jgi:hypothetical protein
MNAQHTATASQYRDGQTIHLRRGWTMHFVMNWNAETPFLQGFVHSPRTGRDADWASLNAARHEGVTTEHNTEIPHDIAEMLWDERFDDHA